MKILLVYPRVAETFWSFKHVLRMAGRRSAFPPLGALTVAAMLPAAWEKRLVDLNVKELRDEDLAWADYVFISAMIAQEDSARVVIRRCKELGVKTVGGGPLFLSYRNDFTNMIDHLVLGEGESIVPEFAEDLQRGIAKPIYQADGHPQLNGTPIPLWDLVSFDDYACMSIQYSRGCPFNCEFCDIIVMNGRIPRTKGDDQVLAELDALYDRGWRGSIFMVDDNFIGNKHKVKSLLRKIIEWKSTRSKRVTFFTEASVDLAEDLELINLMVAAGFNKVFLGLETPSEASLKECGKSQNLRQSLSQSVKTIQSNGLAVMGGFIIGFDNDPPDIFERQVDFIQSNGIVPAMIGLLTAIPGSRLYKRLEQEGRLLFRATGNNTDVSGALNFIPKMDRDTLIKGYQWVMNTVYSPEMYYKRLRAFMEQYRPRVDSDIAKNDIYAFLRSLWYMGVLDRSGSRKYYWKILKESVADYRQSFSDVMTMTVYGYHFRKLFWSPNFPRKLEDWLPEYWKSLVKS